MTNHDDRGQGNPPGTLTADEVKDELHRFKDKLLGVPGALRGAVGRGGAPAPGQPAPQPPAPQPRQPSVLESQPTMVAEATMPAELAATLAAIEGRLGALEQMVAEIRAHLIKPEG